MWTKITPNTDTFYTVVFTNNHGGFYVTLRFLDGLYVTLYFYWSNLLPCVCQLFCFGYCYCSIDSISTDHVCDLGCCFSDTLISYFLFKFCQGAYIKYVGGGAGGFYKFFKNIFVAQETIDLNILWPSNFFGKYFMAPLINFSFLFKAY